MRLAWRGSRHEWAECRFGRIGRYCARLFGKGKDRPRDKPPSSLDRRTVPPRCRVLERDEVVDSVSVVAAAALEAILAMAMMRRSEGS